MNETTHTLLQELRSLLHYHQQTGIEGYRLTSEVEEFLQLSPLQRERKNIASPGKKPDKISGKAAGSMAGQQSRAALKSKGGQASQETLANIGDEVVRCHNCDLARKRIVPVSGSGGSEVKLFIVGGWLSLNGPEEGRNTIFGTEEDSMVERMLAAIRLSLDQVYITNVIKCGIGVEDQPQAGHVDACLPYLERQIKATMPTVICTMGHIATRSLLKIARSLSQLRGKFYQCTIDQQTTIPMIPTYHPTFLLKNPEMKKATWADLQAIERALQHEGC